MKIALPLAYTELWTSRRMLATVRRSVISSIEVDVPEVVGSAVVASWEVPGTVSDGARVPLRHHEGQFYVRASFRGERAVSVRAANGMTPALKAQAVSLVDFLYPQPDHAQARDDALAAAFAHGRMYTRESAAPPVDAGGDPMKFVSETRESAAEALLERSDLLVVVGDELWQTVEEPVLVLMRTGWYGGSLSVAFGDNHGSAGPNELFLPTVCEMFSLLDVETVAALVARRGVNAGGIGIGGIRIEQPGVFGFDRMENLLGRTAVLAQWFAFEKVGALSKETADAFISVRDMAMRFKQKGSVGMPLDAARKLVERVVAGASAGGAFWHLRPVIEGCLAMLVETRDPNPRTGREFP